MLPCRTMRAKLRPQVCSTYFCSVPRWQRIDNFPSAVFVSRAWWGWYAKGATDQQSSTRIPRLVMFCRTKSRSEILACDQHESKSHSKLVYPFTGSESTVEGTRVCFQMKGTFDTRAHRILMWGTQCSEDMSLPNTHFAPIEGILR